MQPCDFGDQCLTESSDSQGIFQGGGHITDTELNRVKERMRANIPPDTLGVVDATGKYQIIYETVKFCGRGKQRGDARTGEALPNDRTIRLCTRVATGPEGGIGGESQQVWHPCTQLIEKRNRELMIIDTHMDMEPENQNRATNILILFLHFIVAHMKSAPLLLPASVGMRSRANQGQ